MTPPIQIRLTPEPMLIIGDCTREQGYPLDEETAKAMLRQLQKWAHENAKRKFQEEPK